MLQETSRYAYLYSVLPNLGERQKAVYDTLRDWGPLTNEELNARLGWKINRVTPRTNELVKMGLVRMYERRTCAITGFPAIAWEASRDTLF